MQEKKFISIITINFNNGEGLQKTLASVWERQNCADSLFEHIIIDGGSTDNSLDIIEKYRTKLAYVVSEPDSGIYNAMNKGIQEAKGEYVVFMNSGDAFVDNVLSSRLFDGGRQDIIYCDIFLVSASKVSKLMSPTHMSLDFLVSTTIQHQAAIIRRTLFDGVGYNESMKIASDWEFFICKIVVEKCSTRHYAEALSYYDITGISGNADNYQLLMTERKQVLERLFREHASLFVDGYVANLETLKYIFKSQTWNILGSHRMSTMLRRWVKPMFLIFKCNK